jgi:hypothetical protein
MGAVEVGGGKTFVDEGVDEFDVLTLVPGFADHLLALDGEVALLVGAVSVVGDGFFHPAGLCIQIYLFLTLVAGVFAFWARAFFPAFCFYEPAGRRVVLVGLHFGQGECYGEIGDQVDKVYRAVIGVGCVVFGDFFIPFVSIPFPFHKTLCCLPAKFGRRGGRKNRVVVRGVGYENAKAAGHHD